VIEKMKKAVSDFFRVANTPTVPLTVSEFKVADAREIVRQGIKLSRLRGNINTSQVSRRHSTTNTTLENGILFDVDYIGSSNVYKITFHNLQSEDFTWLPVALDGLLVLKGFKLEYNPRDIPNGKQDNNADSNKTGVLFIRRLNLAKEYPVAFGIFRFFEACFIIVLMYIAFKWGESFINTWM